LRKLVHDPTLEKRELFWYIHAAKSNREEFRKGWPKIQSTKLFSL